MFSMHKMRLCFFVFMLAECRSYITGDYKSDSSLQKRPADIACTQYKQLKNKILKNNFGDSNFFRLEPSFKYPHMAAIGWESKTGNQYLCGGSIVSEKFILTAAHCRRANYYKTRGLDQAEPSVVKVGTPDLLEPSQVFAIRRIIAHEKYNPPEKYYDIALVQLKTRLSFGAAVLPACLVTDDAESWSAVATGWGATTYGRMVVQKPSRFLHEVAILSASPSSCDDSLANHNWPLGTSQHQLCGAGGDTCAGDSGAPLQIKKDSMTYVIGITSFGSRKCGLYPAIYTKVAYFVPWIETIVWPDHEGTLSNDT